MGKIRKFLGFLTFLCVCTFGAHAFATCDAGYYIGVDDTCIPCGEYSSTNDNNSSSSCVCDTGYTSDGTIMGTSSSTTGCLKISVNCEYGTYLPAHSVSCEVCPKNKQCDGGMYFYDSFDQGVSEKTDAPVMLKSTRLRGTRGLETITLHWVPGYDNPMDDTTCVYGETFSVPTDVPDVLGRHIAYWSANGQTFLDGQQNIPCDFDTLGVTTGTVELTGTYAAIEYPITYYLNGGINSQSNPATYTIDSKRITFVKPSRDNSTFVAWYTNPEFTGSQKKNIPAGSTGDVTVYAKWQCIANYNDTADSNVCVPNTYNITYSCGDGVGTPPSADTATYDQTFHTAINTCSRSGWLFDGWAVSDTEDIRAEDKGFTWKYSESKTLTAHWIQTPGNCLKGTYYDSTASTCKACPDDYTSDLGAEGINACYTTCQATCIQPEYGDLPEHALTVSYALGSLVDGIQYYGSTSCTTEKLCPYDNVTCEVSIYGTGYYHTGETNYYNENGEKNTNICARCPSTHPRSAEGDKATSCFQWNGYDCNNDPDLVKDDLAMCTLETETVTGVVYYPNQLTNANTKKFQEFCTWNLPCSCPSGYTASSNSAECTPNVYTITLDDTDGSGGNGTIYEKYANGFMLTQDGDDYITNITKPTLEYFVFFGYWDAIEGGTKVIDEQGKLPSAYRFTDDTTLYARWTRGIYNCTAGFAADRTTPCAPGYYCPGENAPDGEQDSDVVGCQRACPTSDAVNTTVTSPTSSTSITDCYSTSAGIELVDGNGGGDLVCNHQDDTEGSYDNGSCQDIIITYCNAGYYKSATNPNVCVQTDEGYWSPAPSDTTNGDPASIQQYSCGSLTGAIDTATDNKGAQSPTECYNICTPKTISNGTTVADESKAYYNGSEYALCTYTATCDNGYNAAGNGTNNPTCNPASYTVTYTCGAGTGTAPASGTATYLAGFTPVDNTGCVNPGYSFAGWSDGTTTHNSGEEFTWTHTTNKDLIAQWTPNIYEITLADTYASAGGMPATLYVKYGDGWYTDSNATHSISGLTQTPIRTGYEFAGYTYNDTEVINADGQFVSNTFATSDVSVNVVWVLGKIQCSAGYYYTGSGTQCTECLPNAYCPGGKYDMESGTPEGATSCPTGGKTDAGAGNINACYNDTSVEYDSAQHGSGISTCYYNSTTDAYDICTQNTITQCDAGYYFDADLTSATNPDCSPVGPGYYSSAGSLVRTQCPSTHPLSFGDETPDIYHCYAAECPMAENAKLMTGRNYYDETLAGFCAIRFCMPGYYLQDGACVQCRAGFYCDGTDGGVGDGSTQCPGTGDDFTTWQSSNIMSTKAEDCYATCLQRSVTYGTAYPVAGKETVHYPNLCEFYGISETDNPCDADELANGNCVESACHGAFEMKNGVCSPCNRDANAVTYEENGNCIVKTCKSGYHPNIYSCVENKQSCKTMIPNAEEAYTEWDFTKKAFGTCNVSKCTDGYHISSNACVLDDQTCTVPHGIGTHEWDAALGTWGPCIATSCDAGYTSDPDEKLPGSSEQCGECKNKYVNGEPAVSSYISGCEIASCMYQGEKFALNGDRCESICLASMWDHDDKLESIGWNQSTKKCERTCKPGYIPY